MPASGELQEGPSEPQVPNRSATVAGDALWTDVSFFASGLLAGGAVLLRLAGDESMENASYSFGGLSAITGCLGLLPFIEKPQPMHRAYQHIRSRLGGWAIFRPDADLHESQVAPDSDDGFLLNLDLTVEIPPADEADPPAAI